MVTLDEMLTTMEQEIEDAVYERLLDYEPEPIIRLLLSQLNLQNRIARLLQGDLFLLTRMMPLESYISQEGAQHYRSDAEVLLPTPLEGLVDVLVPLSTTHGTLEEFAVSMQAVFEHYPDITSGQKAAMCAAIMELAAVSG